MSKWESVEANPIEQALPRIELKKATKRQRPEVDRTTHKREKEEKLP